MRPLLLPLLAVLALAPIAAHAQQMYKCTVDGRTAYSDKPCSADAGHQQKIQIDAPPPARDDPAGTTRMPHPPGEPYTNLHKDDGLTAYQRNMQEMQRKNDLNAMERTCIERQTAGDGDLTPAAAAQSLASARQVCAWERQDLDERTDPRNR